MPLNPESLEAMAAAALAKATPEERSAFLDEACAGDAPLRAQLETLIQAGETARLAAPSPLTPLPPDSREETDRANPPAEGLVWALGEQDREPSSTCD